MQELKPPTPFSDAPRPWFFLAGSIEMDRAERWQERVVAQLAKRDGSILNPRRDSWDASWRQDLSEPRFVEQVEWELAGQEQADLILMYFAPETRSPITLLELGLFAKKPLILCCPEGFWRKGNVDVVAKRYGIATAKDLDDLAAQALKFEA